MSTDIELITEIQPGKILRLFLNVYSLSINPDAFDNDWEFSLSIIICPRFISSTAESPHWFNESEDSIFEAKVAW